MSCVNSESNQKIYCEKSRPKVYKNIFVCIQGLVEIIRLSFHVKGLFTIGNWKYIPDLFIEENMEITTACIIMVNGYKSM